MTTAEENFYLLEKFDADRQFLLLAMLSNPLLLARADACVREWLVTMPASAHAVPPAGRPSGRKRPEEAEPTFGEKR
jgi:hypothetical protein